jgi:hypothetical protein
LCISVSYADHHHFLLPLVFSSTFDATFALALTFSSLLTSFFHSSPTPLQIVNPRSALLSNLEVLTLLRELDTTHVAQQKTAQRIKKEDDDAGRPASNYVAISATSVPENLRTVEMEAIQYLSAPWQPTGRQTEEGVAKLVRELEPYGLTKAEKLQVVNLAPVQPVELYVVCLAVYLPICSSSHHLKYSSHFYVSCLCLSSRPCP